MTKSSSFHKLWQSSLDVGGGHKKYPYTYFHPYIFECSLPPVLVAKHFINYFTCALSWFRTNKLSLHSWYLLRNTRMRQHVLFSQLWLHTCFNTQGKVLYISVAGKLIVPINQLTIHILYNVIINIVIIWTLNGYAHLFIESIISNLMTDWLHKVEVMDCICLGWMVKLQYIT